MPIGRLIRKIQCQLIAWVRMPPASRPIEPPAEATKPKTPIAFACSRGSGNMVTIMPRTTAEAKAPPTPAKKRPAISIAWLSAAAQSSEAAMKTVEAGEEDAPLAEQVAHAAGEQQQAAEGDQVGVDDPGEVALGEAEAVLDRGQGDVHDRHVEDDHQHPAAEDVEGEPAAAVGGVCGHLSRSPFVGAAVGRATLADGSKKQLPGCKTEPTG